jgi:hypothetical protein
MSSGVMLNYSKGTFFTTELVKDAEVPFAERLCFTRPWRPLLNLLYFHFGPYLSPLPHLPPTLFIVSVVASYFGHIFRRKGQELPYVGQ